MTDVRLTIVDLIREVDPGNTLDLSDLGAVLGLRLAPHFEDLYPAEVQAFVVRTFTGVDFTYLPDLAEVIVRHFRLDQEI